MENSTQVAPKVGMGATLLYYTDRSAATITNVYKFRNRVHVVVQLDNSTRIDNNGMSDQQNYSYSPNHNSSTAVFTLRKNGKYVMMGALQHNGVSLLIGYRCTYYDYSF